MAIAAKCRKLFPLMRAVFLISVGIFFIISQPQEKVFRILMEREAELVEGATLYDQIWIDVDMYFNVYLFHVKNPDEVMEGELPELVERGPYVYNMNVKKNILRVDEDADEIEFTTTRTMHFNKALSKGSEDDQLTIINSGYIATIGTIQSKFAMFMPKFGNEIHKLFPGMDDIFVRGRAGDLMFGGMPMACDAEKYPELKMICGFFMGKLPEGVRRTDVEGIYAWSFFGAMNRTEQGPFTVNRGVKNKTRLGDITSVKGKKKQKLWGSDECNFVRGTDAITWAPMRKKYDSLYTFEPSICRTAIVDFKKEVVINGLVGWRYEMGERIWETELYECYCPQKKKLPVCPIKGVMDLTPCKEAPLYYSEPHFLHGDPALLEYAKGLNPSEEIHANYITIEPYSGAPLSGSKNLQLSVKVFKSPIVTMLANVSDGFLPMLWVQESAETTIEGLVDVIQSHRLLRLTEYLIHVPLTIGIFMLIKAIVLFNVSKSDVVVTPIISSKSPLIRTVKIQEPGRLVHQRSRSRLNPAYN